MVEQQAALPRSAVEDARHHVKIIQDPAKAVPVDPSGGDEPNELSEHLPMEVKCAPAYTS